jgi:ABC-type phosphate transport system substrate-binding protein
MMPMNRVNLLLIGLALGLSVGHAQASPVAVVSARSMVMALSKDQVSDIFLGKLSHYPDGILAVPIDQQEGSGARDDFYRRLADKSPAQLKAYWSRIIFTGRGQPPGTVANDIEVKRRLAANPAAIGYIDSTLVDASVRVLF